MKLSPAFSNWQSMTLLVATVLVAGCSPGEPEDIRAWMKESSKDLKAKIPELPKMQPLAIPSYSPGDMVSPFSPEKLQSDAGLPMGAGGGGKNGVTQKVNPDAHPLVRVPLEAIRLLGTLRVGKEMVALMAADRNAVFRVRVGDYIGQGNGRVTAIHPARDDAEAEVLVRETVMEKGLWVERDNRVTAPSQGEKK
jgi:type IV pilus assembly protein PilP